ncbi:MAG TPA: hypothetical protein VKS21_01125 [Spirochaetota bacterium]|nr:hypothetical protein [Spirochaetota bacterium]
MIYVAQGTNTNYAARRSYELELNGYDDWYLPSRKELALMATNLASYGLGNFVNDLYHSSSEFDITNSWYHGFPDGSSFYFWKIFDYRIRSIRYF